MAQIMGIAGLSGSRPQKLVFRGFFRMKKIALTTALTFAFSLTPLAVLADDAPAANTGSGSGAATTAPKKSGNVVTRDAEKVGSGTVHGVEKVGKGVGHGIEKVGSETKKGTMGIVHGTEKVFKGMGHGVEKMGSGTKKGFEKMTGHGTKKADPAAGAAAGTGTDTTPPATK
jgi:hypothetical protein